MIRFVDARARIEQSLYSFAPRKGFTIPRSVCLPILPMKSDRLRCARAAYVRLSPAMHTAPQQQQKLPTGVGRVISIYAKIIRIASTRKHHQFNTDDYTKSGHGCKRRTHVSNKRNHIRFAALLVVLYLYTCRHDNCRRSRALYIYIYK